MKDRKLFSRTVAAVFLVGACATLGILRLRSTHAEVEVRGDDHIFRQAAAVATATPPTTMNDLRLAELSQPTDYAVTFAVAPPAGTSVVLASDAPGIVRVNGKPKVFPGPPYNQLSISMQKQAVGLAHLTATVTTAEGVMFTLPAISVYVQPDGYGVASNVDDTL